jgi:hypothetical protein
MVSQRVGRRARRNSRASNFDVRTPRTDTTSSMGGYKGSLRFQVPELGPKHFAVMPSAMQYGGDDRDLERVIVIPEFLEGEAEKWFC